MGDEDIDSEDEQYIIKHSSDEEQQSESEDDESFNKKNDDIIAMAKKRKNVSQENETLQTGKKRKSDATNNTTTNDTNNNSAKTTGKAKNLLIETGRDIHKFDTEVQATFLWTCVTHFLNKPPSSTERNIHSNSFISSSSNGNDNNNNNHNMSYFLKQHYTSCKKLKNWKYNQSFKVIIVCISARRAVSILKNIGPLKISIAKLFPKHMSLPMQKDALEKNNYGVAIGTPNRLLKLWQEGAFHLKKTDFIVMDCWKDAKILLYAR